ncbi:CotH kinase family protein, partial [bacterium]|nr:CotH kinase family protein [bacterium]
YGSRDEWRSLIAFFDANTFESDAMLAAAAARMDLDNYAALHALAHATVFYSWTYGTFMIREKKPGARWTWTVWDGDRIFTKTDWNLFTSSYSPIEPYLRSHITDKLLQNASYRTAYINRTADLLNTLFTPASVQAIIDSLAGVIRADVGRDAEKWGTTMEAWEANVLAVRDFADRQPGIVRSQFMEHFNLDGTARLDLGIVSGSGRIRVNTVVAGTLPWSGIYFKGVPVTLTALPDPGYRFGGWTDASLPFSETVTWTPDGDRSVSAVFLPVGTVNCQVTAPSRVLAGRRFPVVVRIRDGNWDIDPIRQTPVTVRSGAAHPDTVFRISRGAGTGVMLSSAASDFVLSVDNTAVPETRKAVSVPAAWPSVDVSGTLPAGETVWDASSDRVVTAELTVPAGSRLVIRPGTWVLIRKNVNIKVRGSLVVEGTENDPVLFVPENWSEPWGGLDFRTASGAFRWCFFVNGGGDDSKGQPSVSPSSPSYEWHTGRQHILYANGRSDLNLDHCFILNSRGKALGAHFSTVTETNCVTSFVWHGGELHWSRLFCRDSHFMNLPNDDGVYTGDIDTDGFHIDFVHPDHPEYSIIDRCFFVTGKDDAVDQHGARLR